MVRTRIPNGRNINSLTKKIPYRRIPIKIRVVGICYGPYKQASTGTQRGLGTDGNQCTRCRTDGTSGAMGRGVAESRG